MRGAAHARGLGFEPAGGFADAAAHLGSPPGGRPAVGFGRDGRPFCPSGPYDSPRTVVQTLEPTCGTGNYDYVAIQERSGSDPRPGPGVQTDRNDRREGATSRRPGEMSRRS